MHNVQSQTTELFSRRRHDNLKYQVRTVVVPAETRTGHLLNISQKHFKLNQLDLTKGHMA
jgi:hypothetical protein